MTTGEPEFENQEIVEQLKNLEMEEMKELCKDKGLESVHSSWEMTPTEHFLMGSTWPGKAFHPNLPLSILMGRALENLNDIRQSLLTEVASELEGKIVFFPIKYLPLAEEHFQQEEITISFEIAGETKDAEGNILENIEHHLLIESLRKRGAENQVEERKTLLKKVSE